MRLDHVSRVTSHEQLADIVQRLGSFLNSAIEGVHARSDGNNPKWKQIGVNEITDSRELPLFI